MKRMPTDFKEPSGEPRGIFNKWEIYWIFFCLIGLIIVAGLDFFFRFSVFDILKILHIK